MFKMMAVVLIAVLTALASHPAAAQAPAAPWPDSARWRELPRPDWILVIPARRTGSGRLVIWDRNDPWTRAWRVPATIGGLRVVTLHGDTEDGRSVTPEAIDGMIVDEMAVVMRKYGAPALALAVTDGHSIALAGWVPGHRAAWTPVSATGDMARDRLEVLAAVPGLFSGGRATAAQPLQEAGGVTIEAFREREDGGHDYRILVRGERSAVDAALDAVAAMSLTRILEEEDVGGATRAIVSRDYGAADFEGELRRRGIFGR